MNIRTIEIRGSHTAILFDYTSLQVCFLQTSKSFSYYKKGKILRIIVLHPLGFIYKLLNLAM